MTNQILVKPLRYWLLPNLNLSNAKASADSASFVSEFLTKIPTLSMIITLILQDTQSVEETVMGGGYNKIRKLESLNADDFQGWNEQLKWKFGK